MTNPSGPRWSPGARCHYCGQRLARPAACKPHSFTRDHVVPRSRGGSDKADNLVAACRSCNLDKSAQSLDQWRAVLARRAAGVPSFTPSQIEWMARHGLRLPEPPLWLFHFERMQIAELLS